MEQESDTPIPMDEEIIWPKGRQIKQTLPKFGSNRPPWTIRGWKKHDNDQNN